MLKKAFLALNFIYFGNPPAASAQPAADTMIRINTTPLGNFVVALVVGVLLAVAFQMLLTALTAATGVSSIGSLEDRYRHPEEHPRTHNPFARAVSAIGAWTLVTTSFSLFLATLLAVRLSMVSNTLIAVILGLSIWAAFYAVMTWLEIRSIRSFLGGLFHTAGLGLRSSFDAIHQVFKRSDESRFRHAAEDAARAVRREIAGAFKHYDLEKKFRNYFESIKPRDMDPGRIREELATLLNEIEIKEEFESEGGEVVRKMVLDIAERRSHLTRHDLERLGQIYDELIATSRMPEQKADKAIAAAEKFTPGSEEEHRRTREKIEQYLRDTNLEEINPDILKEDLNRILSEPASAKNIVMNRLSQIDHNTIVTAVAHKQGIDKEKAEKMVTNVENALSGIKNRIEHYVSSAKRKGGDAVRKTGHAGNGGLKARAEKKLRSFFDSFNRPEFEYERMKLDMELMMHDPAVAPQILKARLREFDKNSLIALLNANKHISRQDAEKIVDKFIEAKDRVTEKAEEAAKKKIDDARFEAVHQAERARQTAVTASWWLFFTALISGITAGWAGAVALIRI